MKRMICCILSLVALLSLVGCVANSTQSVTTPVAFYYCRKSVSYDSSAGMIASEIREGAGYENDPAALLALYLQGPVGSQLISPFPPNVKISHYSIADDRVQIVLSKEFSSLSGIDLTLASTCLAQTLFDLTDAATVHIVHETESSNGMPRQSITITKDNYLLTDTTPSP